MEREIKSTHKLLTDYSKKARLKSIIIVWGVFLVIFLLSKVPAVQTALISFTDSVRVDWVSSSVNFFINGLWVAIIPMAIFSLIEFRKKQEFDIINIYENGLGFFNSNTQSEKFENYNQIYISYGSMQESFFVEAKKIGIKSTSYGWKEFEQPGVMESNFKKYAIWNNISKDISS